MIFLGRWATGRLHAPVHTVEERHALICAATFAKGRSGRAQLNAIQMDLFAAIVLLGPALVTFVARIVGTCITGIRGGSRENDKPDRRHAETASTYYCIA
jgi:hypothetical protein